MMQKSDSGLSVVIGFIMLLMIIAMIIGTWALVGVPAQTRNAEDYHAIGVTNAFLDYKIEVDNLRLNNQSGVNVSMQIPAASAYSSGALILTENVGTLTINENGNDRWTGDLSRLSVTFGTTKTGVGYEGGGVYRKDYGYATWVTPPMFELDNLSNDLYVTLVIPKLEGSFSVGSTEGIPVDTGLKSSTQVWETFTTNQTVTISYTADETWDAALWRTAFFEAVAKYENAGKIANITCDVSPISEASKTASLLIYPVSGKIIHINVLYPEYDVDVRGA